jgi:hypothetical protein
MILVLPMDEFDIQNMEIQDKIKNSIIYGGCFNKIIYTDPFFTLNSIFIELRVDVSHVDKYFNKYKVYLKEGNDKLHTFLSSIEENILYNMDFKDKDPVYRIKEQLKNNYFKVINNNNNLTDITHIILKISGIWSDHINYGLTFRFFIP